MSLILEYWLLLTDEHAGFVELKLASLCSSFPLARKFVFDDCFTRSPRIVHNHIVISLQLMGIVGKKLL